MADVWKGLAACYASLVDDVRVRYGVDLRTVAGLGISGMMHGYVALDAAGELLVPFRTWRNNITGVACAELTPLLDFAVPQRWSIAHLYQSILEEQPHVARIAHLTTLAGYVHWRLTGEHVGGHRRGVGDVPDRPRHGRLGCRADGGVRRAGRAAKLGWTLRDILPAVLPAGRPAGTAHARRARGCSTRRARSRPASRCAPRGRRGHRHGRDERRAAALGQRLRRDLGIRDDRPRAEPARASTREIDIVVTPDGTPGGDGPLQQRLVGPRRLDGASRPGRPRAGRGGRRPTSCTGGCCRSRARRRPRRGGLLAINYVSGEHMTGFTEGRPLFARTAGQRG